MTPVCRVETAPVYLVIFRKIYAFGLAMLTECVTYETFLSGIKPGSSLVMAKIRSYLFKISTLNRCLMRTKLQSRQHPNLDNFKPYPKTIFKRESQSMCPWQTLLMEWPFTLRATVGRSGFIGRLNMLRCGFMACHGNWRLDFQTVWEKGNSDRITLDDFYHWPVNGCTVGHQQMASGHKHK